jgi:hypothetical protein
MEKRPDQTRSTASLPSSTGRFSGFRVLENKKRTSPGARSSFFAGAKDGSRTRDLDLGKVALYQLSYFRVS